MSASSGQAGAAIPATGGQADDASHPPMRAGGAPGGAPAGTPPGKPGSRRRRPLWRSILLWFIRLIVVLVLLIVAALMWLGTETGLGYALTWTQLLLVRFNQALVIDQVEGNLWRGVRIGRFEWRGANMMVRGSKLHAYWSLRALLRGKGQINELSAETFTVQLPPPAPPKPRVDLPMPGNLGLPVPAELRKLRVGHFELLPADVDGKTPAPLLVLKDVDASFSHSLGQYQITSLSLTSPWGRVESASAKMDTAPPHAIEAEVVADGQAQGWPFRLTLAADGDLNRLPLALTGRVTGGEADIEAVVQPLRRMPVERLKARLANTNLAAFTALGNLPQTRLNLDADIQPEANNDEGWQGRLILVNGLPGTLAEQRIPLRGVETGIRFTVPPAERFASTYIGLDGLVIELPVTQGTAGNGANGTNGARAGSAIQVAPRNEARIAGRLETWPGQSMKLPGISLPLIKGNLKISELDLAPLAASLPPTALSGQVQVDGQKFLVDIGQTVGRMRTLLPDSLQRLAADAQVRLAGTLDERWLKLDEGRAALGQEYLTATGQVSVNKPHELKLKGGLRKLDLARWLPPSLPIDALWREGSVGADWAVDGRLLAPGQQLQARLDLVDTVAAGHPLQGGLRGRVDMDAGWKLLSLTGLDLNLAHGDITRIQANGALGRADDTLSLKAGSSNLSSLDRRLAGGIDLNGQLQGSFDALEAKLRGKAQTLDFHGNNAAGEPMHAGLKALDLRLEGPLSVQKADSLNRPLDVSVSGQNLRYNQQVIDRLRLTLFGSLAQHQLSLVASQNKDRVTLQTDGKLLLPREGFRYQADIETLDLSGRAAIRLQEPTRLNLSGKGLDTANMHLSLLGGRLHLDQLVMDWANGLKIDTQGSLDGLQPLQARALAGLDSREDVGLLQGVRASGNWNLRLNTVDDIRGSVNLGLREVPDANGKLRLGLRANNGASMNFNGQALDGRVRLDLPTISSLNLFLGSDLAVDGAASLDGTIGGTLKAPRVDLAVKGTDLAVLQRSAGFSLQSGTLDAHLDNEGLTLRQLRFRAGEGSMLIRGGARLVQRGGTGEASLAGSVDEIEANARRRQGAAARRQASVLPMDGNFDVVLDHFLVPIGPGQKVIVSGETTLSSNERGLSLTGNARVDEGAIDIQSSSAPTLPGDVKVVGDSTPQDQPGAQSDDASLRIRSNLKINLGEKLNISGNGVQARLGGNLAVTGFLPANPQLTGVVNILDGSYRAYGQDLKFTRGIIRFNGPVDNPSLDLRATRPFLPVEVGLAITGLANNPQVALESKPSMSETTKLSWLVLGVPPEEAGGAAQSLALQQAGTLLLGGDPGSASPSLADRLGLDVLNYGYASDTDADTNIQSAMTPKAMAGQSGDADSAEAGVVSLGKRINDRLFVSYEKGVRGVWQLLRIQYRLGKGYIVRAQTGTENAIDLLRSRSFN
ncbi:MAG: translocation/assembly module TamB domain-containing protein [Lautropia sp.]|nr:translocation/assembly module TamB domain-containing protein [Lautropia sp.]